MKLTPEQEAVLQGAKGPAHAEHLRLLVEWGEAFGAERLIPVESVMINGLSVPNHTLGDVPYQVVESYIDSPAITHLPTDAGAKPEKWCKLSA